MTSNRLLRLIALTGLVLAVGAGSASALKVTWMRGFAAPGTPAKFDKVGVIKVGPSSAKNVLVLEPGTSAGGAYFVPLAKWIVSKTKGWQVWSVERRENLLEDQSELNLSKEGQATADPAVQLLPRVPRRARTSSTHFQCSRRLDGRVRQAVGDGVAVQDLRRVIETARKLGGKVVLGGHSLGGSVVTAYATWNFAATPGPTTSPDWCTSTAAAARPDQRAARRTQELPVARRAAKTTPWLSFGGIAAPYAGLFNATGSAAARCSIPTPLARADVRAAAR